MSELISPIAYTQPAMEVSNQQRLADQFLRQAPQIAALGTTTPPAVKTESPRAPSPTPITKAYDHHGDIEKEEEPVGERLFFKA